MAYAQTTSHNDGLKAGTITVRATNASSIDVTTGAASVAAAFGGGNTVAFSIAIAAAINTIHTRTAAYVSGYGADDNGSSVGLRATTGAISVTASSSASIYADTIAASMAVAIGGGSAGVSIAGAGAGAGNDIVGYTKAYVHDTDVRAATDVTVSTNQTNIIGANVAAVAAAAGASGTAGVGVALGGSFAFNNIRGEGGLGPSDIAGGNSYDAQADTSATLVEGDLVTAANGQLYEYIGDGETVTFAGYAFTDTTKWKRQAQRYDVNFSHRAQLANGDMVKASDGNWYEFVGTTQSGDDYTYFSDTDSDEDTDPVTDFEDTALWRERVTLGVDDFEVHASITDGDIRGEDLRVTSNSYNIISTTTAAGAAAITGGGTVGVGVAGSFAFTANTSRVSTLAYVDGDYDGDASTGLEIDVDDIYIFAEDQSGLSTLTAAASLAASFSGTASISVSFGGAISRNVMANTVKAYMDDYADVTVAEDGEVEVLARQNAYASTEAWAAAAAVAVSGTFSLSLSGAGAEANNVVDNAVEAYIEGSTVNTSRSDSAANAEDGDVIVKANNDLVLRAKAGAIAAAINGGIAGGSGAIGATIARNYVGRGFNIDSITEEERDRIDQDSSLGGDDSGGIDNQDEINSLLDFAQDGQHQNTAVGRIEDSTINAGGDVIVRGDLTQVATTEGYAGSLAVGISIGGAVAAAGAESTTKFSSHSDAAIIDSSVTAAGDVIVQSTSSSLVDGADAVGASLSGGVVAVSIGVAMVVIDIENKVEARIESSGTDTITAGDDVVVKADVTRAEVRDLEAVMASVSIGGVALAGGGLGLDVEVDNDVDALISGANLTVNATDDVSVIAEEDADLRATAVATSIAVGLSGGGSFGVSVVLNTIKSNVRARIANATVTGDDVTVKGYADSRIWDTTSAAISASTQIANQLNLAFANINTVVQADTTGTANITAANRLTIFADQFSYLRAHGAGGSFGTVAVGGLLVQGTVGKGLVEFDQKAVDDETGAYNYTGNSDADVVASAGGTLKGNVISVIADYSDDLFVDSTAAGGGAISLSGSVSVLENYVRTSAEVADSANIDATTFNMTSTQTQDNDYNADSYSIALASGAGAMAFMNNQSNSVIAVGNANVKARRVTLDADNTLEKREFSEDGYSLRSGSAAIGNVNILVNRADINNSTTIGFADGANITASGSFDAPSAIEIHASTDVTAYNRSLAESVSGFGLSVLVTETDVSTINAVNIGAATLDAGIGDLQIFTDHESLIVSDSNLMMVSAVTGVANATSNSRHEAVNTVNVNGSTLAGRNIEVFTGQAGDATLNRIYLNSASNIFAASMYPNISIPIALGDVDENNRINVTGDSRLRFRCKMLRLRR